MTRVGECSGNLIGGQDGVGLAGRALEALVGRDEKGAVEAGVAGNEK